MGNISRTRTYAPPGVISEADLRDSSLLVLQLEGEPLKQEDFLRTIKGIYFSPRKIPVYGCETNVE